MSSDLNAIKARLGSISDKKLLELPAAVRKIVAEDMPQLFVDLELLSRQLLRAVERLNKLEKFAVAAAAARAALAALEAE